MYITAVSSVIGADALVLTGSRDTPRPPATGADGRSGGRRPSGVADQPVNCGWTAGAAHGVTVIRRLRVFVPLAAVNWTRATTAFAPRRSELVRSFSVHRPLRSAFVTVLTCLPPTRNVTRRIWRPVTVAETDVVRGHARGPRRAAVPRAARAVTPATCCAGAVACGVSVGVTVGVTGGCGFDGGCARVSVVVNVSSSVTTLPFSSVPSTSATLTTDVWPPAVCTWQV